MWAEKYRPETLDDVVGQDKIGAPMRTSRAGLTADASGEKLVLGALPKANDNISCLDELDKFDQKPLQGLLEALEEGGFLSMSERHTRSLMHACGASRAVHRVRKRYLKVQS